MADIIIDRREKNSLVASELAGKGLQVEFRELKVADYVVGNVAIERKTISDFLNSMTNRRLIRQLQELQQFRNKLLIIEGYDEKNLYSSNIHDNAIRGFLLSIMLDRKIPIIFTKDYEDTANFLHVLHKRLQKKPSPSSLKAKRRAFNISEQQRFIIESFPGIGPATARALLKEFRTIRSLICSDLDSLKKTKKLNKTKAEIFHDLCGKEYKELE